MATNQEGPMTPHADLVARLDAAMAELSACVDRQWNGDAALRIGIPARPGIDSDLVLMGALKAARDALAALPPPAPHADLVARLRAWARDERLGDGALLLQAADALAAFPPPTPHADLVARLIDVTDRLEHEMRRRWRRCAEQSDRYLAQLEALGVVPDDSCRQTPPKSRPADPPALVALVREAQRLYNANITREADADELTATMEAYNRAIDAVLAYPLPAAPPVTDTPAGQVPAPASQRRRSLASVGWRRIAALRLIGLPTE